MGNLEVLIFLSFLRVLGFQLIRVPSEAVKPADQSKFNAAILLVVRSVKGQNFRHTLLFGKTQKRALQ